ncbi:hypothetical protein DOTSEDRAFT_25591 [Dothistroma septosporum NZE10]|uniref:Uncharacterized protein n=1 Tax=Dothistroma septosporum (strain NZE10 / CBS 128990) TaxID=675120 RepID=M2YPX4_DOTSN|nr:hypothetical protein DOTSEDRAFT_25591 [Dothistroma septosporum NZE10]
MPRTVTETVTVTRFGIDGPPPTSTPSPDGSPPFSPLAGFGNALTHVGLPAIGSTIMFLLTTIAVFLATAAVSFLVLQLRPMLTKLYSGTSPVTSAAEDKKSAIAAARSVTFCHVVTVLALVLRTREALAMVAPMAYEVCALILAIEVGGCVVLGGVWGVVKVVEYGERAAKAGKTT